MYVSILGYNFTQITLSKLVLFSYAFPHHSPCSFLSTSLLLFSLSKNGKRLFSDSISTKKRFGELHKPRTRFEKKKHLEILGHVFFDMSEAMTERESIEKEEYKNIDKNISDIILKNTISKKNETLKCFMRYCVELKNRENKKKENGNELNQERNKNIKNDMVLYIHSNIRELAHLWNSCEIGIILNCFLKMKINEPIIFNILLNEYFKRNQKFSEYGSLYVLKFFSKINLLPQHSNNLKMLLFDILKKLNRYQFFNLCLICNYSSSLYNFDKILIKNFIQEISNFVLKKGQSNEKYWTVDSIHFLINSCARVGYLNKEFFIYLENEIKKNVENFSIDQIVSLTNGYSKFKNAEESNFLSLFLVLSEQVIKKSYLLKPRHLSVLANAFNNACIRHEHLFHIITEISIANLNAFEPQQIVMLAHSYVNLGMANNELLKYIWKKIDLFLNELSFQELGMTLQAYTKGFHEQPDLLQKIKQKIVDTLKFSYPFLIKKEDNYNNERYEEIWNHLKKYKNQEKCITNLEDNNEWDQIFYFLFFKNKYWIHLKNIENKQLKMRNKILSDISNSSDVDYDISHSKYLNFDTENKKVIKKKMNEENCRQKNNTKENIKKEFSEDEKLFRQKIIQHIGNNLNPTLVCSILYSLVKGSCHVYYDLITLLAKLSFLFVKHFKITELANVCVALSETFVSASEENVKQNNIIAKYQKEEMTDVAYSLEEKQNLINSVKEIKYDECLYNTTKQYLIICELFFDEVNSYLIKTDTFNDIHSIYKLITSFGSLRLEKYAPVSLHLFKLNLLHIKNLTYLPLQKMANAFMQMKVYDEDVYAYINKIQKMKKKKL